MHEPPLEEKFKMLCQITRAQHFAWREAIQRRHPALDPGELVDVMWRVTGESTGRAYLKHLDPRRPLPAQVAGSIAWSSQCMGENVSVEVGDDGHEAFVRHHDCPWFPWHERQGLLDEDLRGCDTWFASTVEAVNQGLGCNLRCETLSALPAGDSSCLRRFWIAETEATERLG